MNLKLLAEPFPASDIEWRIQSSGAGNKGPWAKVLAYLTSRAIMDRLDEVCGPENWRNEFRDGANNAVLCGISINVGDGWVTKWDGAENTDIEAVKGGLSSAMKRAGVQWGIGRYLYMLEEGFAKVGEQGEYYAKTKDGTPFRWSPPALPRWALPASDEKAPESPRKTPPSEKPGLPPVLPLAPIDVLVKGKRLGDYASQELYDMQKALRKEGQDKHKQLLGSITTVLNDRTLGPSKKNAPPLSDEQRGELVKNASAAPDDLPFPD